jgi:hypothetical protein
MGSGLPREGRGWPRRTLSARTERLPPTQSPASASLRAGGVVATLGVVYHPLVLPPLAPPALPQCLAGPPQGWSSHRF